MSWCGASWRRSSAEARGRAGSRARALLPALLLAAAPVGAQRLVVLPLENLSGELAAEALIGPLVEEQIRARGWAIAPSSEVVALLADARVRRLDSLDAATRDALLGELAADGYVATSVLAFRSRQVPVAAVAVRLVVAAGEELFDEVIGLSAEDTRGPLDERPVTAPHELARIAVERLFRGFPAAGAAPPSPGAGVPRKTGSPPTFRSAELGDLSRARRVAVLPFRSFVDDLEAARITGLLMTRWLARAPGFEPVERSDLRQALIAERIRDPDAIGPDEMQAVGGRVGCDLFLRGTLYRWTREASTGSETSPPEVELNLTLVDAGSSRILWTSHHRRRGDDYRGLLRLGAVSNVVALADRVIAEMVAAVGRAKPVTPPRGRELGG